MFYSDKPISKIIDDKLDRDGYAKLLAQALINLNSSETFSVGLYGKRGSGKTSLVNLMIKEIEEQEKNICEEDRFVVVHFEPWNFSDANQLLSQFLIRLSDELRSEGDKYLTNIGEALETLSDAFVLAETIPIVGGVLALFGKKGASALGKKMKKGNEEKDIFRQKELVINLLGNKSRRILIVIDDFDRLNNEQIRQVFQLVTSVANFPKTVYLLVFDKEIVVKALEKVQEGNGDDYLEKIIQMPIQIPDIQKETLRQLLFNQLFEIRSGYKDISFQEERWQRLFRPCIDPFIKGIRDLNRLCNLVQFKLTTISSEVDFTDMVAISALEISLQQVYEWVKNNKSNLTGELDISTFGRKKTHEEWYESFYSQIQLLFHCESEDEKKLNTERAIGFLSRLFPFFGQKIGKAFETYDLNEFLRNNQIAHPDKFDRYFNLDLDNIGLKKAEIKKAVHSLSFEDFRAYLLEQDKNGTSYIFLEEVSAMISEISADRAKGIINALLSTAPELGVVSHKGLVPSRVKGFATYLIIDLLEVVVPVERFYFLESIIHVANFASLQSMAEVIYMLELGYGRLTANGEERNVKKIISLEELIHLEDTFTQKVKGELRTYNLFDFGNWPLIHYLLECFDSDFANEYLANALSDDNNIVRYLDKSVTTWSGTDIEYEIKDAYKKHLTQDRVLRAIESQKKLGNLFLLPEPIQNKCCAFVLHSSCKDDYRDNISQQAVAKLHNIWKQERV